MEKLAALETLGQDALLLPSRITLALKANDRLKLYLTLLQVGAAHGRRPEQALPDLGRDIAAAGIPAGDLADWLRDLPAQAQWHGSELDLPGWGRLAGLLRDDLQVMAAPLLGIDAGAEQEFAGRGARWVSWLAAQPAASLSEAGLAELTRGERAAGDSLHLLVMDLHKALNALFARLAVESVAGAQVWGLADGDAARVAAFMRGIHRTVALKLDHPGLDTVATRDGDCLLLQNDIGTNDAHVLVLKVEDGALTLTYSDLHAARFAFFQELLADVGATWTVSTRQSAGLNAGHAYQVGVASVAGLDAAGLEKALEAIGARIVFLIDWNRARKRLQAFVDKPRAIALLLEAARREIGHMPWLRAGGEALIWDAMAAQGGEVFRLGDRLDGVLGEDAAAALLLDALQLASAAALAQRPAVLVRDEVRLLLARLLHSHSAEFDLLHDHAGYCQALAQMLDEALARGVEAEPKAADRLAERAKIVERRADELVVTARERARRQGSWKAFANLLEQADDIADALEEAVFLLSLIAGGHAAHWNKAVRDAIGELAQLVNSATQDHVRLVVILRNLDAASDARDHEDFLSATWRMVQAERSADELLRAARRALARELREPAALLLANDLAAALERATDVLLAVAYALRQLAFERSRVPA